MLVFPGGDWEVHRPSWQSAKIDFGGRTGFVRLALEQDVPIVPVVTIGGQETALWLDRGAWLAKLLRLDRTAAPQGAADLDRAALGPHDRRLPAAHPAPRQDDERGPARRSTCASGSAPEPDIDEVYEHVTGVMQDALDGLAAERRFPVIG